MYVYVYVYIYTHTQLYDLHFIAILKIQSAVLNRKSSSI